ncbi:ATP-dependent protease La (LON) domain protein [Forsythia ovata]|uniref:Protein cereblon n=1 Tax=Forsythia ovata TaxID=205694 RepID=A0ABD1WFG0_9LAMI
MDDERILERERYQIEQILQLESEELQVEEVEESSDDDDVQTNSGVTSASVEFTYDTSLAALHSYLGEVEYTHNRLAFLDGGAVLTLPLFYLEGVVLFPEARLPLRVILPNFIAAVERALRQVDAPYSIGVVRLYRDPNNGKIKFATTGTTAEIRQYRRLEDGSVNIVARGQQRFRLRRHWIDGDGAPCGEVQIIQEDLPLRTPQDAVGKLAPLRNLRIGSVLQMPSLYDSHNQHSWNDGNDSDAISEGSFDSELSSAERMLHRAALVSSYGSDLVEESVSSDDEKFERDLELQTGRSHLDNYEGFMHAEYSKRNEETSSGVGKRALLDNQTCRRVGRRKYSIGHLRYAPRAFWPSWVYHMYDSYILAQRAADRWKHVVRAPSMDGFVMKPDLLSFHIASKIPVSESTRQELLEIDGISYRLRREIELLESLDRIRCKTCQTLIARRSDMLVMSTEGPLGAYANPHGFVHEVTTLFKANGLAIKGLPSKEYSWFPGYAWSIADCASCENHMGWLFTATRKKLKPRSFWGIRSSQVADETR